MKASRKYIALLLSVLLVLTMLAGCGSTPAPAAEAPAAEAPAAEAPAAEPAEVTPERTFTINCHQSVPLFEEWQKKFAEYATELSGGRIAFEVLPTGTMGNSTECLSACQMGTIDFVEGGDVELGPVVANSDWCSLPYYIVSHEQGQEEYMNGFIGEYANKQYAESGLINVARIDNSFRTIGVMDKTVNSSADLKGLRLRVPNQPLAMRIYELMGALPVALSASEVLIALEQGTIDGADNAVLLFDQFKQFDMFESIVLLNYSFGTINLFCSEETWNTLSAEDQALLQEAGQKASDWYHGEMLAQEAALIERGKAENKHIINPDEAWQAEMAEYADIIWDEVLASGKYDETFINQLYQLYLKNTGR